MARKGKKAKKKLKKLPTLNKRTLSKFVLDLFDENPSLSFNYKQISKTLGIKDDEIKLLVNQVLAELLEIGRIQEEKPGKFKMIAKTGTISGKLDLSKRGTAIVISDDVENEIFIPQAHLNHALHGDMVEVFVYGKRKQEQLEGEVTKILQRAKTNFVGVVSISKNFAFLVIEHRYMPYDIFIPLKKLNGAKQGQKAIAKIIEWPDGAKNPIGEIVEVLGKVGDHETEMHAILAEFDLPYHFPEEVNILASKISESITNEEINKRKDFRKVPTFTIDPEDAKDFDDALSIQILPNGNYEIGVHIADVSYYVEENSQIDKEAVERGTSVYLVDRVVPMLPEKLSNEICSLQPNKDKLTFSVVVEMDEKANVLNRWIGRTVINSDRRFNYDEAQQIIETGYGDLSEQVLKLHALAQKLRNDRFRTGAIGFERIEVKFNIDAKGKPLGVYFKESKESNQLIEEFMLLANKIVAEFVGKPEQNKKIKTFVYRVHDEPDLEKLGTFSNFIKKFGYNLKLNSNQNIADSLNGLLTDVKGKNEEDVIQNLAIRTMAKAEYSTKNIGHYGLAFDYYSHFTSPIRRYPDLMVHRLLDMYLNGKKSANQQKFEKLCKLSSEMENRAVQAERASIKYKSVEFMKDKVGQFFDGVISGLTEFGMFVEIVENKIEGMISLKELNDDFYVFDEENYCITGHYNKQRYQLGDKVKVQVARANVEKKMLDFNLVKEIKN